MLISDFARLGQVSVRMLRHYDAVGLLEPDHVDASSGYRSYSLEQLPTLNRVVALKELGFNLEQVRSLLDEAMAPEELRGMLRMRHAQLQEEARVVSTRLAAVESRLRMIEQEEVMPSDYVVKSIPAVRLVGLTATLDPDRLGEHIGPMFRQVEAALTSVGASLATAMATYAATDEGMDVVVGYGYDGEVPDGLEAVELPQQEAVCGVHLGPMSTIGESWQALLRWVEDNDYTFAGPCRELYIRAEDPDQANWVTELEQPVTK